jgi:hypothetical protein
MTIELSQDTLIDGVHFAAGEPIVTTERMAQFLIAIGRASTAAVQTMTIPDTGNQPEEAVAALAPEQTVIRRKGKR